jgi:hypothetical protein
MLFCGLKVPHLKALTQHQNYHHAYVQNDVPDTH